VCSELDEGTITPSHIFLAGYSLSHPYTFAGSPSFSALRLEDQEQHSQRMLKHIITVDSACTRAPPLPRQVNKPIQ